MSFSVVLLEGMPVLSFAQTQYLDSAHTRYKVKLRLGGIARANAFVEKRRIFPGVLPRSRLLC